MESTSPPTSSSCTHLRTCSNSGEPMAAYSPPTQGMMSCPTFSRSVSEARVLSTQRWSAAESGVVAPGLAGPSRRRAEASTPGTMVGCTSDDAGAQAKTNAATPILKLESMISYRRNVRGTCQRLVRLTKNPGIGRGFFLKCRLGRSGKWKVGSGKRSAKLLYLLALLVKMGRGAAVVAVTVMSLVAVPVYPLPPLNDTPVLVMTFVADPVYRVFRS